MLDRLFLKFEPTFSLGNKRRSLAPVVMIPKSGSAGRRERQVWPRRATRNPLLHLVDCKQKLIARDRIADEFAVRIYTYV